MVFPRFKLNAHVVNYTIFLGLTVVPALYFADRYGKEESQIDAELIEKYPEEYKQGVKNKQAFQAFLTKMKNNELDDVFDDVLKRGKMDELRSNATRDISKIVLGEDNNSSNDKTTKK